MYVLTAHSATCPSQEIKPPDDEHFWEVISMTQSTSTGGGFGWPVVSVL